ncbi:MAG: hypothetical protein JW820_16290, partial [Spirochaetales bacterium]|nr:hypothetical protein [Spirochaetales bacterium]
MPRRLHDPAIHGVEEFREIIRYERARAGRSGSCYALVSLELGGLLSKRRDLRRLLRTLHQRIRATDVLGWLDDQTLSVLLPATGLQGGLKFAAAFQKHYGRQDTPLPFTVSCHPEQRLGGSVDGSTSGANGGSSTKGSTDNHRP